MSTPDADLDRALTGIRAAVARQLGVERPPPADVDPATLPRFSSDLADRLPSTERERLIERAARLEPWLQGPFLLGEDLIVGGTWRNDTRWYGLRGHVPEIAGRRVLDVGSNAGYDPFMFNLMGAEYVLACEPFAFIDQARFLEEIYRTGVDFQPLAWQDLDPQAHGRFDLVHCHGVLYHELHPMAMLQKLRPMLADEATMLFGSMMLADPALSEYARFVPGSYYGDETWWWVPGRLAMRWMLEAAGFRVDEEFGVHDGPAGEFPTVNGYFSVTLGEPPPAATYVRA